MISKTASARTITLNALAGEFAQPIADAETSYGIPSGLLLRQLYQESSFNPQAVSPVGALGIAQFMPNTAKDFGIDPLNPLESIDAAADYMSQLKSMAGSWKGALASYNWGIGNWRKHGMDITKAPQETQDYVTRIAGDLNIA